MRACFQVEHSSLLHRIDGKKQQQYCQAMDIPFPAALRLKSLNLAAAVANPFHFRSKLSLFRQLHFKPISPFPSISSPPHLLPLSSSLTTSNLPFSLSGFLLLLKLGSRPTNPRGPSHRPLGGGSFKVGA